MANEEWRPVVGHEGFYDVSDHGRVRSVERTIVVSDGRIRRQPSKILSNIPNHPAGYIQVNLSGPRKRHVHVHHLVLETFVGPRPDGMYGCHNDGDPTNNTVGNLRWDTPTGNSADKRIHGTEYQSNKTHCSTCGFEYNEANTIHFGPDKRWRRCRNCENRHALNRYHRNKNREGQPA